ncbi:hypothetical protein FB472_1191 [Rhodoglobus vestalii]|uniref:Uncharacterized protein n=1 Tax=Rhodoglobus vestalii TaxID=193384 RepID=A0A8H2K6C6_9MICO|nr:hypothetical protein [Rhodoglobus vestalii]TQO19623.1 hypothetical protein FB472_1191 [Rhodoglobus vestalii]
MPSLGPDAWQFPQLAVKPEGCTFIVSLADERSYRLGLTVNNVAKSVDESCVEAVAFLRTIANQGATAAATPTCDEIDADSAHTGVLQEFTDRYFRGSFYRSMSWAWQECNLDFGSDE